MAARKAKTKPNVSAEELITYYRDMLLIRRFEEKAGQLYGMGLIGGLSNEGLIGLVGAFIIYHILKKKDY